jgi:CTP:molybdopterin cytidylyltransferase MocA
VILAAGQGRRLGRPKALCRAGGRFFLELLAQALRQGGCRPLLAVVRPELASRLEPICRRSGMELLVNTRPEWGQISSLRLALEALTEADGALVVLVDQGELSVRTILRVRRALGRSEAAVAAFRRRPGHPLAFRRDLFPRFFGRAADGGAHRIVEELAASGKVALVNTRDPGVVRNLNTPQQLREFLGAHSSMMR